MQGHLTDEQLTAALVAANDAATETHLAGCAECRAEQEALRGALDTASCWVRAAAERPEGFWQRQRASIAARLAEAARVAARPWGWATAFAALLLAAMLLNQQAPPPQTGVAPADPDHALLLEVQRSVRREVPQALEPAALLAYDLASEAQKHREKQKGEKQ